MFTSINQKKLTNISIISLKIAGKKFELAVYPNKLYEYQKGLVCKFDQILCSPHIFRNLSRGDICSDEDIKKSGRSKEALIKEILDHGHEQKNVTTREYETAAAEREVLDILQEKIRKNGRPVNMNILASDLRSVHQIIPGSVKKQAQDALAKLIDLGYERAEVKVWVSGRCSGIDEISEERDGFRYVKSDNFPRFKSICNEANLRFVIHKNLEDDKEEIFE